MSDARVHIQAPQWAVDLRGDEAFVEGAFDELHDYLVRRLEASVIPELQPMQLPKGPGRLAIEVEVCHDLYRRTHLLERSLVQTSQLGAQLDVSEIVGIYVERSAQAALDAVIALGKPAFSRLTEAGASAATLDGAEG